MCSRDGGGAGEQWKLSLKTGEREEEMTAPGWSGTVS